MPALSFEYHERLRADTRACLAHLTELGFSRFAASALHTARLSPWTDADAVVDDVAQLGPWGDVYAVMA